MKRFNKLLLVMIAVVAVEIAVVFVLTDKCVWHAYPDATWFSGNCP